MALVAPYRKSWIPGLSSVAALPGHGQSSLAEDAGRLPPPPFPAHWDQCALAEALIHGYFTHSRARSQIARLCENSWVAGLRVEIARGPTPPGK